MDQNGPPIPPRDFLLRSASGRTSADIDPPPEPCGNDPRDGFVRFRSPGDYYAVRTDALVNSVTLYRIAAGRREMIGGMDVNVSGQARHTLGVAASEDRLTVFFDGKELFVATDRRFPEPPGKVGLWTHADSMTLFEALEVSALP